MVKATAKEAAYLDTIGKRSDEFVVWQIGADGPDRIAVEKEQAGVWHARTWVAGRQESGTGRSPKGAIIDLRRTAEVHARAFARAAARAQSALERETP